MARELYTRQHEFIRIGGTYAHLIVDILAGKTRHFTLRNKSGEAFAATLFIRLRNDNSDS